MGHHFEGGIFGGYLRSDVGGCRFGGKWVPPPPLSFTLSLYCLAPPKWPKRPCHSSFPWLKLRLKLKRNCTPCLRSKRFSQFSLCSSSFKSWFLLHELFLFSCNLRFICREFSQVLCNDYRIQRGLYPRIGEDRMIIWWSDLNGSYRVIRIRRKWGLNKDFQTYTSEHLGS